MKLTKLLTATLALCLTGNAVAQSEIYPQHFDLAALLLMNFMRFSVTSCSVLLSISREEVPYCQM